MVLKTYVHTRNLLTKESVERGGVAVEAGKGGRGRAVRAVEEFVASTRNELTQMKFQWKIYERIKFANQIAGAKCKPFGHRKSKFEQQQQQGQ